MFEMGYGDSYAVREALSLFISPEKIMQCKPYMGYASKNGHPVLEAKVRGLILASTGEHYQHVIFTTGAHLGVGSALKAMEKRHGCYVYFDELHFLRYPQLVRSLGFTRMTRGWYEHDGGIRLTASPSNPTGELGASVGDPDKTIWDACYHNEIYTSPLTSSMLPRPGHALMVGSLGKLTGLNGLRLGWVATNDPSLAEDVRLEHYNLTLGLSTTSLGILDNVLDRVDMHAFFWEANRHLSDNRGELSRLEYMFARPVPRYGMFWFTEADRVARRQLERAGVTVIEGTECGGSKDTLRITLGQTRHVTKHMVRTVLDVDGK